ncbi:Cys-tRNA(Pro) deacylase, prolyl-tRNA editing enzyme YbaK/EbsC [Cognatiyoonia koreensis]|uniref:Cys-tRNA(Pro) deacylase, prolyl-tRNA editing enzyme YbaK/EbsC n=1 Tax=Cognatiyoonia koreensis TaxID=364200 RepID=A0A1I0NUL8_9RHOB|nr:YbaK/EbsC family protein [Cognatiyoonia koreensis]SEW05319.1 Cys-tRNA(Pro) deacylase, prolyl-tRNA editing enzyme YbaK/EbsC [Cognatiyoonia koreensis]
MSKSLKRVVGALRDAGLDITPLEMDADTRTAQQAADVAGCHVDQIGKSVIFAGQDSEKAVLFITAGGNQVDPVKAAALAGEPLGKADAALIRAQTGFAIGGVSPVGHLNPIRAFLDPRLQDFATIWVAAGTPRHIFEIAPDQLLALCSATVGEFTT